MRSLQTLGAVVLAAVMLAACERAPSGPGAAMPQASRIAAPSTHGLTVAHLYVGNRRGGVTEYLPGSDTPLRTITQGVAFPEALAFDGKGDLYVANGLSTHDVSVYAPGATVPLRELTPKGAALTLAFDASGQLYVGFGSGKIGIYAPGATSPSREITTRSRAIQQVALDSKGNLYVLQAYTQSPVATEIRVYAPGGSDPVRAYKFTADEEPTAIALDASDNFYVGMKASKNPGVGRVDVFEAETTQLVRRYNDLGVPAAIAFDAAGDVYVADSRRNDVYIYQVRTLLRRLTDETDEPVALAFDENENVYVSNTNGNAVTVYQAGKKTLIRSITGGIDKPKPLAFGP